VDGALSEGKMDGILAAGMLEVDAVSVTAVSDFVLLLHSGIGSAELVSPGTQMYDINHPLTRTFSLFNHV
jgi:hypothetical protein